MNRQLSMKEVDELFNSIINKPAMSRRDKLLRWAQLVRECGWRVRIFHCLEYMTTAQLKMTADQLSAFSIAAADPEFKAAGLNGETAYDAIKFFELSTVDLHAFSCDCGGPISNRDMADRIEYLA